MRSRAGRLPFSGCPPAGITASSDETASAPASAVSGERWARTKADRGRRSAGIGPTILHRHTASDQAPPVLQIYEGGAVRGLCCGAGAESVSGLWHTRYQYHHRATLGISAVHLREAER